MDVLGNLKKGGYEQPELTNLDAKQILRVTFPIAQVSTAPMKWTSGEAGRRGDERDRPDLAGPACTEQYSMDCSRIAAALRSTGAPASTSPCAIPPETAHDLGNYFTRGRGSSPIRGSHPRALPAARPGHRPRPGRPCGARCRARKPPRRRC